MSPAPKAPITRRMAAALVMLAGAARATAASAQAPGLTPELTPAPMPVHAASAPAATLHTQAVGESSLVGKPAPHTGDKLTDLPLVEIAPRAPAGHTLAEIVSGAGRWASLDHELGEDLAHRGVAVVGLNALEYLWTARRPEALARDLERILDHCLQTLGKRRTMLVGYSLGAEVLPFMASRRTGAEAIDAFEGATRSRTTAHWAQDCGPRVTGLSTGSSAS